MIGLGRPAGVDCEVRAPGAVVALRRYCWPNPNEVIWDGPTPTLAMNLSIQRPRGEGYVRYDPGSGGGYHPIGAVMLRPGGVPVHAYGTGGEHRIVACDFDPQLFAEVTALTDWDASRFAACADLTDTAVRATLERLHTELQEPSFKSEIAIEALTQLLLVELARGFGRSLRDAPFKGGLAPWQLRRLDDYIHTIEGAWPSCAELARLCQVSRAHLSRAFKVSRGAALSDHLAAVRIERAKSLLAQGRTVQQTAAALGFAKPNSFTIAFRRATSQSASDFRRRLYGLVRIGA